LIFVIETKRIVLNIDNIQKYILFFFLKKVMSSKYDDKTTSQKDVATKFQDDESKKEVRTDEQLVLAMYTQTFR
jgi:hypothetical protein